MIKWTEKEVSMNEIDKIKSAVNTYPFKLYNIHLARFISPFDLYPHSLKTQSKTRNQQCSYNLFCILIVQHLVFFIANTSLFTEYELPAFVVKFDVTYSLDTLATNCIKNFDALLKDANTTISSNRVSYCSLLDPGEFIIDSISSSSLTFKVSICLSFVGTLIKNMVSIFQN